MIPALTVRQPWAWAWLHGKPVENRSWRMAYRGPLYLHAGARSRWDPDGADSGLVYRAWKDHFEHQQLPVPALRRSTPYMAFGAVTALVQITGCHHADECARTARWQDGWGRRKCCPWAASGQHHIEFRDVRPLAEPVPCGGALGLWPLPEDVAAKVRQQLHTGRDVPDA